MNWFSLWFQGQGHIPVFALWVALSLHPPLEFPRCHLYSGYRVDKLYGISLCSLPIKLSSMVHRSSQMPKTWLASYALEGCLLMVRTARIPSLSLLRFLPLRILGNISDNFSTSTGSHRDMHSYMHSGSMPISSMFLYFLNVRFLNIVLFKMKIHIHYSCKYEESPLNAWWTRVQG